MSDYDAECIIRFLKQNGEYSQADIDLIVSLIKKLKVQVPFLTCSEIWILEMSIAIYRQNN